MFYVIYCTRKTQTAGRSANAKAPEYNITAAERAEIGERQELSRLPISKLAPNSVKSRTQLVTLGGDSLEMSYKLTTVESRPGLWLEELFATRVLHVLLKI